MSPANVICFGQRLPSCRLSFSRDDENGKLPSSVASHHQPSPSPPSSSSAAANYVDNDELKSPPKPEKMPADCPLLLLLRRRCCCCCSELSGQMAGEALAQSGAKILMPMACRLRQVKDGPHYPGRLVLRALLIEVSPRRHLMLFNFDRSWTTSAPF